MKTWHWVIIGVLLLLLLSGGSGDRVQRIAEAIALAEGFYAPGSLPQRRNNPGDIKVNGVIATYESEADGWEALRNQIRLILENRSGIYTSDMSIYEVAELYTGGDNPSAWAHIVSAQLGVSPDTALGEVA